MSAVLCPQCDHEWHSDTCVVSNGISICGCKSFKQLLKDAQEQQKQERLEAKTKPHLDFIIAANNVGFTNEQAEFMWAWMALKHHEHWDGHIG